MQFVITEHRGLSMLKVLTDLQRRILERCTLSASGCLEWQGAVDGCGYGQIRDRGALRKTHRIMANAPDGIHTLHSCDNPKCCNPSHLSLGTHTDNMIDKSKKRRVANGSGTQKLSEEDVRNIRISSDTQERLAQMYGVARTTITNIKCGNRYGWVKDE